MNWTKALMFVLCVNLATWIVAEMEIPGVNYIPVGSLPVSDLEETATRFRHTTHMTLAGSSFTGYIIPAVMLIWDVINWVFAPFPAFLSALGVPSVITIPLQVLWYTVIAIGVAEFLRGYKSS